MHKVLYLQKKEPTKHCTCHATTLNMSEANVNNDQVLRATRQKNEPKHKQMHSTNKCTQQAHSRENTHTCYPSPYSHVFLNWITKPDFLTCHQTQCHIRGKWQNQHFCGFSFPFLASSFASSCRSGSLSRNKQKPKQGSKNCWAVTKAGGVPIHCGPEGLILETTKVWKGQIITCWERTDHYLLGYNLLARKTKLLAAWQQAQKIALNTCTLHERLLKDKAQQYVG